MKKAIFLSTLIFLISCDSDRIYEEFKEINNSWPADEAAEFDVQIDSVSQQYNVDFHVKNQLSYPFNNLYFQVTIQNPEGQEVRKDLKEIILFDPKTGEPEGSGLADSFENTLRIYKNLNFEKAGTYRFHIRQFMRMDTLPAIERVGLRVAVIENQ